MMTDTRIEEHPKGALLKHFHDVTRSIALIGCRSIQLRPEAFWSMSVDSAPWKSKMNWEVRDQVWWFQAKAQG